MKRLLPLLALLALTACEEKEEIVCDALLDELRRCDVPGGPLLCEELDIAAQGLLLQRFRQADCDATLADGEVDYDARVCELLGYPCPAPLFPDPRPQATRNPMVFVGGIDSEEVFSWHRAMLEDVARFGHDVHLVNLTPWASREERAADLWRSIQAIQRAGNPQVNLVCYAVGGLDCRYLVSPGGLFRDAPEQRQAAQDAVAVLVTVGTPHRGTQVAQAALDLAELQTEAVIDAILGTKLIERADTPSPTALQRSLLDLTPAALADFNDRVTDAPGLVYESWAGVSHVFGQPFVPSEADVVLACTVDGELRYAHHPDTYDVMSDILWATAPFAGRLLDDDGSSVLHPNDGMIAVASARWGTFRGCVPADHYDLIGQIGDRGADPLTGFDAARFFANIAADLAQRGF